MPLKAADEPIFRVEPVMAKLALFVESQPAPVARAKAPPKVPEETTADKVPTVEFALLDDAVNDAGDTDTEVIVAAGPPVPVMVSC
jgi:hypothetical protein